MDTSKSYVRDGRIQQKPRGNYFLFSFLFGLALAFVIFAPVFFASIGLKTDISGLTPETDIARAETALQRAMARIQVLR